MRWLSKTAKRKQVGVADVIYEGIESFVAKCEAEAELETKIIKFPMSLERPSAFHQLAQRIAFRDHDARQQSRSFASWNQYPAIRGQVLLRRQGGDDFLKTWIAAQRIPKRIETFKREQ